VSLPSSPLLRSARRNEPIANQEFTRGHPREGLGSSPWELNWCDALVKCWGRQTCELRMDFKSSLILLVIVFALGCFVGYFVRAQVSRNHRRRLERTGGYPVVE